MNVLRGDTPAATPQLLDAAKQLDDVLNYENENTLLLEREMTHEETAKEAAASLRAFLGRAVRLREDQIETVRTFVDAYHPRLRDALKESLKVEGFDVSPWATPDRFAWRKDPEALNRASRQRRNLDERLLQLRPERERFVRDLLDGTQREQYDRYWERNKDSVGMTL